MTAGRSGGRWRRLVAQVRATEATCWRCGQSIDWSIPYKDEHGNVQQDSGTVEHKLPWSTHPHLREDPGNLAASHWRCNAQAGDRTQALSMGTRSRTW